MKEYFETLKLVEGGEVDLENGKICKVQDMSLVCLMMFDNREFLLYDVRYVPELN
jgi:hypothetical protein